MSYQLVTNRDAKNFTPGNRVQATFGYPRTITNITLHWWGKPEWQQTWEQVMWFFCDSPSVSTSAHEVISDGIVGVIVDHSAAAWANGNAKGNAQSITFECNPRMSAGDLQTVAERVADCWNTYGILPLTEHREWFATECPGTYSKADIYNRALKVFQGIATTAQEISNSIQNGDFDLSEAQFNKLNDQLKSLNDKLDYVISYSQPGRDGINRDSTLANWMRNSARAAESWAYGIQGVSNQGQLNREFQELRAKVDEIHARPAAEGGTAIVNASGEDLKAIVAAALEETLAKTNLKAEVN